MILDTEKEVKIGLGRDFTKTILGPNQAFLTSSALKYLKIEPNGIDKVQLVIDTKANLFLKQICMVFVFENIGTLVTCYKIIMT